MLRSFAPFQMFYTALKWLIIERREIHSLPSEGWIQEQVANKEEYLTEGPSKMKPSNTDDNVLNTERWNYLNKCS